jgi:uncharacterized BrkB/YihY/UPF0761 family membrane protein
VVSAGARRALEFSRRLLFRCRHDEILLRASALAFSTVLSLVPLLAVIWYSSRGRCASRDNHVPHDRQLLPTAKAVIAALLKLPRAGRIGERRGVDRFFVVSLPHLSVGQELSRIFGVVTPPSFWRRLSRRPALLLGPAAHPLGFARVAGPRPVEHHPGAAPRDSTLLGTLPALATLVGLAMLF